MPSSSTLFLNKALEIGSNKSYIANSFSDYLSFSAIRDVFGMYHPGYAGWVFTRSYSQWILSLISDDKSSYLQSWNNSFIDANHLSGSVQMYGSFFTRDEFSHLGNMLSEIVRLSWLKNDPSSLLRVFPEYHDDITHALVCTYEDNMNFIDQVSTPFVKLYYPEPFIASPSFVHEELWFIHILHFQHWLWFFFISLIMFYFIMFLFSVQYCSARNQPKRETRGVSRSKCADIITACVPVSWAIAIIISETVDATDYYDGFGTGQIVIGIRAYQWGWEYFYPKTIDLNYKVKPSYSTFTGNSLKYSSSSTENVHSNSFWKAYQRKTLQSISSSPAHLLLSPIDNSKVLNSVSFNNIGLTSIKDSTAFKKIQYFSKLTNNGSSSNLSNLNNRYAKINNFYLNSYDFNNSYSYGTFRQHNYSSLNSNLASFDSLLENKGIIKFTNYTLNNKSSLYTTGFSFNKSVLQNSLDSFITTKSSLINVYKNLSLSFNVDSSHLLNIFSFYPNFTSILSPNSDSKTHSNVTKYGIINKNLLKSKVINKTKLNNNSLFNNTFYTTDVLNSSSNSSFNSSLINNNLTYTFKDLKSSNFQFLSSERNVRIPDNLSLKKNMNFNKGNNVLESVFNPVLNSSVTPNLSTLHEVNRQGWSNNEALKPFLSSNLTFPTSHTPIYANKNTLVTKEFDRYAKLNEDLTPTIFNSKEETAPNYLFANYWLTYWSNTNVDNRIKNILKNSQINSMFYMPRITEFAEYDFRNWQALEMLEDSLWESSFSTLSNEEYTNIKDNFKTKTLFNKQELIYNKSSRKKKFRTGYSSKALYKSKYNTYFFGAPLFNEDSLTQLSNIAKKNFKPFISEISIDSFDDAYENFKNVTTIHFNNNKTTLLNNSNILTPVSYSQVLNNFRDNYQEFVWNNDFYTSENTLNSSYLKQNNSSRNVNSLKLRLTARNSVVTYNAIQKVFKSRFDEGRSNAKLTSLANSFVSQPFLTQQKSNYEGILGKNKESFFSVSNYNSFANTNFNYFYTLSNTLNVPFLDIPFLISMKSDASRYLWFDWQARWSTIEIQPSSAARYSLTGVPYFNKSFEYTTQKNDVLNESENYLNRLTKARKNYLPSWSQSPYLYSRSQSWYRINDNITNSYDSLSTTKILLKQCNNYWNKTIIFPNISDVATPSFSGVNTPVRSSWRPSSSIQSYYYSSSILADILSRREYLYRTYFSNKNFVTSLPSFLVASPKNVLLNEVKNSFLLIDPINFSSEITRELVYTNTTFLKFDLLKNFLNIINSQIVDSSVNLSSINNYLFYYLFGGLNENQPLAKNLSLYKNQYRPIKRGVTNMIRLQATGAVAMPIEIRLHIIASSRDVIHSWAVPSAGIKIDCVPGFSSHRVTIFLVSGIFWGQCMEICGRFHHWMPIVVYFMKKDLFFLWCTHFMHYSSISDIFDNNDKQFMDKVRLASFDKTAWVNLVNQIV